MNTSEGAARAERIRLWTAAAVLLLATFLAYVPALGGGFIWDDTVGLTENPLIRRRDGLYYFWFTSAPHDYFPLTYTSFWLEWRLWRLNAAGYHVTNILLHALSAVLLWRILKRLAVPGAFLAGLIFALHPVGVASAAWISERKNTLSAVWCFLSFLLYLRFDELITSPSVLRPPPLDIRNPQSATRPPEPSPVLHPSSLLYWLSVFCFLLALLAKTSVVVLPPVLLLHAWWKRGRVTRQDVLRSIPFFVVGLGLALLTIWFQTHRAIGDPSFVVQQENLWQRAVAAGWAVWFYLWKALWPVSLSAVYRRWDFTGASAWDWAPLLVLLMVLGLGWRFRQSWGRHLVFALGCFVLALLPTLGFINMFYLTYSRVADHWAYLALPVVIASVVGAAGSLVGSRRGWHQGWKGRVWLVLGLCGLGVLAALTFERAGVYANELALWRDTVRKNPFSPAARNNLGFVLLNQGRYAEAQVALEGALRVDAGFAEALNNMGFLCDKMGNHDQAWVYYQKAVKARPGFALALSNWGVNLFERGKADEGMAKLRAALDINPGYGPAHVNLATFLVKRGAAEDALPHALQALALSPDDPDALYVAGNCSFLLGEIRNAADYYRAACSFRAGFADAEHNLAVALNKLGQNDLAVTHFARASALRPNDPKLKLQEGIILAQGGQLQQAVEKFQNAIRLQPEDAEGHNRLGFILAKQGKLGQAVAEFKEAVRLAPQSADAHKNLGNALAGSGKLEPALVELQAAVRLQPTNGTIRAHLARILESLGNAPEASAQFKEALRLEPENADAHYGLANCLLAEGQLAAAEVHYEAALKTKPGFAEAHYQLAITMKARKDFAQSARHLRKAVRLKPDWPEALNNLAWLLATHKDPQVRDGPEAVGLAKHALELRKLESPEQLDTLAAAYAEAGRFQEAVSTAQQAVALAEKHGQPDLVMEISQRLDLYQKGLPYHAP